MKKTIFFTILLVASLLITNISNAQWVQVSSGMGTGRWVLSLASTGNIILAGTDANGVYRSTDNGNNWAQTLLINSDPIYVVAANENYVYAGTFRNGVYRSSNGGITFTIASLSTKRVNALLLDGNNVFAGIQDSGIFLSTNNGIDFARTGLYGWSINSFAKSGSNIIAGTFQHGIYYTTNYGINWIQSYNTSDIVYALSVSGSTVYAGLYASGHSLVRSTTNGANWVNTNLPDTVNVRALASSGSYVWAGASGIGVWFSTDGGSSWVTKRTGFSGSNPICQALLVKDNYIFAGMYYYSVYRRVINGTPSKVILNTPVNNAQNQSTNITFKWFKAIDRLMPDSTDLPPEQLIVTNYWLEYSADSNFITGVIRDSTLTDTTKYVTALTNGIKYFWRVKAKNQTGWNNFSAVWNFRIFYTGIISLNGELPKEYKLFSNYPNPFNPTTNFKFSLPKKSFVKITIYDALGKAIDELVNTELNAGTYKVDWQAHNFASGVYYYKLTTESYHETKKMVLMK